MDRSQDTIAWAAALLDTVRLDTRRLSEQESVASHVVAAAQLHEAAVTQLRIILGATNTTGSGYVTRARDACVVLLETAIEIAERCPGRSGEALQASTLNNVACCFRRLDDSGRAYRCAERVVVLCEATGDDAALSCGHLTVCCILSGRGKHREALRHAWESARAAVRAVSRGEVEELHPRNLAALRRWIADLAPGAVDGAVSTLCVSYHNVGVEFEFLGQYRRAVHTYRLALEIAQRYLRGGGEQSPHRPSGSGHRRSSRADQMVESFERALVSALDQLDALELVPEHYHDEDEDRTGKRNGDGDGDGGGSLYRRPFPSPERHNRARVRTGVGAEARGSWATQPIGDPLDSRSPLNRWLFSRDHTPTVRDTEHHLSPSRRSAGGEHRRASPHITSPLRRPLSHTSHEDRQMSVKMSLASSEPPPRSRVRPRRAQTQLQGHPRHQSRRQNRPRDDSEAHRASDQYVPGYSLAGHGDECMPDFSDSSEVMSASSGEILGAGTTASHVLFGVPRRDGVHEDIDVRDLGCGRDEDGWDGRDIGGVRDGGGGTVGRDGVIDSGGDITRELQRRAGTRKSDPHAAFVGASRRPGGRKKDKLRKGNMMGASASTKVAKKKMKKKQKKKAKKSLKPPTTTAAERLPLSPYSQTGMTVDMSTNIAKPEDMNTTGLEDTTTPLWDAEAQAEAARADRVTREAMRAVLAVDSPLRLPPESTASAVEWERKLTELQGVAQRRLKESHVPQQPDSRRAQTQGATTQRPPREVQPPPQSQLQSPQREQNAAVTSGIAGTGEEDEIAARPLPQTHHHPPRKSEAQPQLQSRAHPLPETQHQLRWAAAEDAHVDMLLQSHAQTEPQQTDPQTHPQTQLPTQPQTHPKTAPPVEGSEALPSVDEEQEVPGKEPWSSRAYSLPKPTQSTFPPPRKGSPTTTSAFSTWRCLDCNFVNHSTVAEHGTCAMCGDGSDNSDENDDGFHDPSNH